MHADPFIFSLLKIYKEALATGFNQPITLSIQRCDYMLHKERGDDESDSLENYVMKQVEFNTIAAGFGYVSTKATLLHRQVNFVLKREQNVK
jgi:hypothetical protein